MGFFTELHIKKTVLPLSQQEKELISDKQTWQSKSFGRELLDVFLDENNRLAEKRPEYEIDIEEIKKVGFENFFKDKESIGYRFVPIHFDGIANFYNEISELWIEFEAEFYDGNLLRIKRIFR